MDANPFICGVVEGFYGRPWSATQRRQLFAWMKPWGMNTYLYAPKDDLKHRLFWREPYPAKEAEELKGLIRECRGKGLRFIYAIAPGLDLAYSGRNDRTRLRRKANQLIERGCRDFALAFDDIPPVLSKEDAKTFGSVADAQCVVANDFLNHLREQVPDATLCFCPTHYCERMSGPVRHSDYLKRLGKGLDTSIQIFWTGPEIVSETITVDSICELQRVLRRKPLLWDNLHANDYDLRRIYLGPYSGRPREVRAEVAGILSNPNCEFEANYIPLRTLAMYAQAEEEWDPRRAFQTALKGWRLQWKTHKPGGLSARQLELLCDCFYLPTQPGPRAKAFLDDFHFLLREPPKRWGIVSRRFETTCAELIGLFDKMSALKNRELLYALYRLVWELREETRLMGKYVSWLKAHPPAGQAFVSTENRPGIYRGGLVAQLQRLLPMDEKGRFRHRPIPAPEGQSNGDRPV
ncbi:MAG TPA: protein O-GlcNAcase [Haliangiales bacterium]|nr:protein O-GlcNAcase [Haliangiales bacterium]